MLAELTRLCQDPPESFNWVRDVFYRHVQARPDRVMLRDAQGEVSYARAWQESQLLLGWMRHQGLGQGQVVAVMSGAHPGLWTAYLALILGGFRIMPLSTMLTLEDLAYRFQSQPPALVIGDEECRERLLAALGSTVVPHWWCDGPLPPGEFGAQPAAATGRDEALFLFYTSGTTGMPKLVIHTHTSYPLGHLTTAAWIGLGPDDLHCNVAQPGWAKFAWSSFFAPLTVGCGLYLHRSPGRFQADVFLQAIAEAQVTTLCAPPTALRLIIQEDLSRYRFGLRECVCAGEPLNPEVIAAFRRGTGLTLRDGYGQTESTLMVGNFPGKPVRPGSMGQPAFLYEVLIADDHGQALPVHQVGQIAVRLPSQGLQGIFPACPRRHGLYYTGDKAYVDEDGYFWFVGRDDDVIKTSDYRVGPFEVESILLEVEGVLESGVVGVPHPLKGQEIKAFIVVAQGLESTALVQRIWDHCHLHLAPYKVPRVLELVEELPKTSSGKIRRVELRARERRAEFEMYRP